MILAVAPGIVKCARRLGSIGAVAAIFWLPVTSRGDLAVELKLEHSLWVQYEPIQALVTLRNLGEMPFKLDAAATNDSGRLHFAIENKQHERIPKNSEEPILGQCTLLRGEAIDIPVSVSRHYTVRQMGEYSIRAWLESEGLRYSSRPLHIDIVSGLPLSSAVRTVPGASGRVRHYELSYIARDGREFIFLSVHEEPSGIHYGTFNLGSLVRVVEPVLQFEADGTIIVVHQSARGVYTRSILKSTPTGVILVDQSYNERGGRVGGDGSWRFKDLAPASP